MWTAVITSWDFEVRPQRLKPALDKAADRSVNRCATQMQGQICRPQSPIAATPKHLNHKEMRPSYSEAPGTATTQPSAKN